MTVLIQTSFVPGWMIVVPLLTIVGLLVWGFVAAVNEEPDDTERERPLHDWQPDDNGVWQQVTPTNEGTCDKRIEDDDLEDDDRDDDEDEDIDFD